MPEPRPLPFSAFDAGILVVAAALVIGAAWVGMGKDLCRRDLPASEYAEMRLTCGAWPYR